MKDFVIAVAVLGIGGAILYMLWRSQQQVPTTVTDRGLGQCGASYAGVGASVPCELLGKGVKTLYEGASELAQPVVSEGKKLTAGVKPAELVFAPVAATHVAVNGVKQAYHTVVSWF